MFNAAKKTAFIVAAAAAAVAAGSASAEQMTMTFTGLGPSQIVGVNYNAGRSYAAGPVSGYSYYYAGLMKWNTAWGQRTTFCTQINEHVWNGLTVTYDVVDVSQVPDTNPAPGPMGAIKAELVRELYGRFYDTVRGSNDATLNAAFQLAIWEITHENLTGANTALAAGQLNLGLGAVQADSKKNGAVVATAGSMLGMLGGASDENWNDGRLFGLSHATAQDQLLIVPIPAVLGVAAAGLLGVIGLRRRLVK
ncbi:MAG: hypothetical protein JNM94_12605 [Phycisphaerae bacterium]|nr:hypothetical protein [Phycisphaerae bacterium]